MSAAPVSASDGVRVTGSIDLERLEAAGHRFEAVEHRELGQSFEAVRFLPDASGSLLNRIAARVEKLWGMEVRFSPGHLSQANARGMFFDGQYILVDAEAALTGKLTPTLLHELRHGHHQHRRNLGEAGVHDASLHAAYPHHPISEHSDGYARYQSAEELSTFAKGTRHTVPTEPSSSELPVFPEALVGQLRRVDRLSQQTAEAVGALIDKLDHVLEAQNPQEMGRRVEETHILSVWGKSANADRHRGGMALIETPHVTDADRTRAEELSEARAALDRMGPLAPVFTPRRYREARQRGFRAQQRSLQALRDGLVRLKDHAEALGAEARPLRREIDTHQALASGLRWGIGDPSTLPQLATELGEDGSKLDGLEGEALRDAGKVLLRSSYDHIFAGLKDRTGRLASRVAEVDGRGLAQRRSPP